jgi:Fic family protein
LPALLADLEKYLHTEGGLPPLIRIGLAHVQFKTTKPTAGKAVHLLEDLGMLTETTGKQRDRTFVYAGYLDKLRVGTEVDVG